VVVNTPADGEIFVGRPIELTGRIFGLTAAGRATYTVDDTPPARPLPIEGDAFSTALTVPPGAHRVVVTATNGGPEGTAEVAFRYDVRIVRDGDRLLADGVPWRFIGLQTPTLREHAYQAGLGGTDRVPEVLGEAVRLGARVLRVPACDDRPGAATAIQTAQNTYNEAGLVALDSVIVQAGNAGLKLLLPLVDLGDGLGGVNQYLRWHGYLVPVPTDKRFFFAPGAIREHFKTYVRMVLGRTNSLTGVRYADDPTILGWEIFTRGDAYGVFDAASAGAEMADFVADVTQVMKAAAPEAIVGTGEVGFDVNPSPYGRTVDPFREIGLLGPWDASHGFAWQRNLRAGTVDFAGLQVLPDLIGISTDALLYANLGAEWIRGHAAIAAAERKPLIVTHAGVSTVFLTPETRRAAAQAWLDEHAARGFTGVIVGNLHPDAFDRRADPYGFAWVENTNAADPQNELVPVVQTAASRLNAEAE
jgi:mannan endo-1,4-beta-mannosidase